MVLMAVLTVIEIVFREKKEIQGESLSPREGKSVTKKGKRDKKNIIK